MTGPSIPDEGDTADVAAIRESAAHMRRLAVAARERAEQRRRTLSVRVDDGLPGAEAPAEQLARVETRMRNAVTVVLGWSAMLADHRTELPEDTVTEGLRTIHSRAETLRQDLDLVSSCLPDPRGECPPAAR